jgi:predicted membrane-bound spermidine synthase
VVAVAGMVSTGVLTPQLGIIFGALIFGITVAQIVGQTFVDLKKVEKGLPIPAPETPAESMKESGAPAS